ncbi:MAG: hypothetical protein RSB38_06195 [Oscillospiraceae bacterium]
MKSKRIKYLLSLVPSTLLFLAPISVNATGLDGVSISGGKVTVDVSKGTGVSDVTDLAGFWNKIFSVGRLVISGVTGIAAIALVGIFAYKAVALSKSSNNPKERKDALDGMLYAFIGAALLGGASLLSGLAYGLFQ